ncbi:SemiSWEET family sugar transporter [Candidatus Undinarchaeota archaeon]
MIWEIIGILAAVLVSSSLVAQIHKGYKTKKMDDISTEMFIILITGMALWLLYGVHIQDLILVGANIVSITFGITILYMKHKFQTDPKYKNS